jgi:GPH family glycoside/pentoside/hexuronide:cation symporter
MVAVTFPYYALYWISKGDRLATIRVFGLDLAPESALLGTLMLTCILFAPFWLWLSHRTDKRLAYMAGMTFWIIVQLVIFSVQPGETDNMLILCVLLGIGLSSAYVLPDSIFPDVIEWDELKTGRRQEGAYYGARAFIRKMTGALAVFATLQLLGAAGYNSATAAEAVIYHPPESALTMIRLLVSPISAVILSGTVLFAWLYPLNRKTYHRIHALLARRKARKAGQEAVS